MRADWQRVVDATLVRLDEAQWGRRIWNFDPTLWAADEASGEHIVQRLGWLAVVPEMQAQLEDLSVFVDDVRAAGFTHAVLCGMGGSSIAPAVFREVFGVQPGYLDLMVLDTTDPATVLLMAARSDPAKTLFVIASKSGGTMETLAFFEHMYTHVQAVKGDRAGENFVAITDPGSSLELLAARHNFRHTFLNRADIGARYSALSYFGLVPAALLGADVATLLARAQEMAQRCDPDVPARQNPGLVLGATLGTLALAGWDKVTLVASVQIATFGAWWEQLIAASTGKAGKGLIPVEGEPVGVPAAYGDDRCFVYLRLMADTSQDMAVETLAAQGYPTITYNLRDAYDLGAQIFLWEFGIAGACALLGVNAFDAPDAWETRDITAQLLAMYADTGVLTQPDAIVERDTVAIAGGVAGASVPDTLASFLGQACPGDYVDFTAYVTRDVESTTALLQMRVALRDAKRIATMSGFGPRHARSTEQLHRGGPDTGLFVQIVPRAPMQDAPIPGFPFSFGTLNAALALADLHAFYLHERRVGRVLRVYLVGDAIVAWRELTAALMAAVHAPAVVA